MIAKVLNSIPRFCIVYTDTTTFLFMVLYNHPKGNLGTKLGLMLKSIQCCDGSWATCSLLLDCDCCGLPLWCYSASSLPVGRDSCQPGQQATPLAARLFNEIPLDWPISYPTSGSAVERVSCELTCQLHYLAAHLLDKILTN